jgi:hypothetical protein
VNALCRKSILFTLGLSLSAAFLQAENLRKIILKEISKPSSIAADNDQLYAAERTSIYIYSLKNFKLLKKFGQHGSGPGEFRIITGILPDKSRLVVNSIGIIYFFSKNGEYINERKTTAFFSERLLPFGEGFVGSSSIDEGKVGYYTINLFDSNMEKGKELYRYERILQSSGPVNPIARGAQFYVDDDKIFIDDRDETIHCFDKFGKKIRSLKLDIEKVEISDEFKKRYTDYLKNHRRLKVFYQMFKNKIKYPAYFPGIRFYNVEDGKIYTATYHESAGKAELLVLDFKGNVLKKSLIPIATRKIIEPYPYTIKGDIFYQLVENIEDEVWILNIVPL